ncbi:MAG: DUF2975 domain-containing protein [Tissierellia bacterium]|nr:DUF2975 domain-containing protein [Tissierellia bacterium]
MKKGLIYYIKFFLVLAILGMIFALVRLYFFSFTVAKENPEIAYMRVPVYLLFIGIIGSPISACFFGYCALHAYSSGKLFRNKTAKALKYSGHSFLVGVFFLILLIIYTVLNVPGSITNIHAIGGIIIYLLAVGIFYLLSDVISQGMVLQEDQDLTI